MSTTTIDRVPAPFVGPAVTSGAGEDGGVRVTVRPAEDVLLPRGATLGSVRAGLAELLRRPELRHVPVAADGVVLADSDVIGERPLLPGATLTVAPGGPGGPDVRTPDDGAAVRHHPWAVARADGRAAGTLVGLAPGTTRTLAAPGTSGAVVRVDRRRPDRVRVRVRRRGASGTGSTRLVRRTPSGRHRTVRVGVVPRRWRPEAVLELPGARFTLHASGAVETWLVAPPLPEDGAVRGPGVAATAFVPVVGSLVLAAAVRQPLYALFGLVGVFALVPQLLAARRRRRAPTVPTPGPAPWATGARPGPGTAPLPRLPGATPGALAAGVVAGYEASPAAWRHALEHARAAAARSAGGGASTASTTAPGGTGPESLLPDGALAVRGPREAARAVARAVVAELAVRGAAVRVTGPGRDAWSWCRWLPRRGPEVAVVDAADAAGGSTPSRRHRPDGGRTGDEAVVLCLAEGADVPSWCRTLWQVHEDGTVHRTAPDGSASTDPLVGVSAAWAERLARRVAGLAGLRRCLGDLDGGAAGTSGARATAGAGTGHDGADPTDPRLPARVPLLDLIDPTASGDTADVAAGADRGAAWDRADGWDVPLGRDAQGRPVRLDLVADGPHLLVAGTTGAGKSELLQSLVLALAVRRSPRDLALALVDFKGGASFGACARLPHVVGQVTDLDAGLAGRALDGLRAELHRRERVLAAHGAADLSELAGHADAPPRLVVVIDEFRALADDLPEFLPGLLRVAAQGRSLGVHLVLATQRPAGAVSADVRANVSARLALRVVDATDSQDVVETSAAARILPGSPGRAVLRVGAGDPVALQCAHAATAPAGGPAVRRAPTWRAAGLPGDGEPDSRGAAAGPDLVGTLVDSLADAASRRGLAAGRAPWLPPLPERVQASDVAEAAAASPPAPGALPVALGDDPAHQRRTVVAWSPADGHLAVVGAARSGRTTALATLAGAALDRGWHVHALVPRSDRDALADLVGHPGFGTLAGPDSPRRAARLLQLLSTADAADGPPVLVVVDGVAELRAALATSDPWDPLAGAMAARGAAFALATDSAMVGGLASRTGPRLVLLGRDAHADVVLGAPSGLAGTGGPPGRAAWLGGAPLACQVLLPEVAAAAGGVDRCASRSRPGPAPVVVRPLPPVVDAASLPAPPGGSTVVLGVGGDAAEPVDVDVADGLLVSGPRGAGRTTVLRLVARRLAATGRLAGVVARDAGLREDAARAGVPVTAPTAADVRALLAAPPAGDGTGVLVVDDLDALAQTCPLEADLLAEATATGAVGALVASATTTGALLAHRGAVAELRAGRTGVVLQPAERGADDVLATPVAGTADPGPPRPGRGALVVAGRALPVQVGLP